MVESVGIETQLVRLNLGCGHRIFPQSEGWINVDLPGNWSNHRPDVESDLRTLPFPDKYAHEIHAIHVVEHFYFWEVRDLLTEWRRVLKPGGVLVLELPDLEKVLRFFLAGEGSVSKTWFALYGDPSYKDPAMCHRWAYNFEMMGQVLNGAGFRNIQKTEACFHQPKRDMRVECQRPNFKVMEKLTDSDDLYVFFCGAPKQEKDEQLFEWEKSTDDMNISRIFLSDPTGTWYLQFLDEIKNYLSEKSEGKKVTCVGVSMGGYAALLFAHWLGGDSISFNPQTDLKAETRWKERVNIGIKETPDEFKECLDIANIEGQHHHLYYSVNDETDRYHAERMNVSLHPIEYHNHNVAQWMKKKGLLKKALRKEQ